MPTPKPGNGKKARGPKKNLYGRNVRGPNLNIKGNKPTPPKAPAKTDAQAIYELGRLIQENSRRVQRSNEPAAAPSASPEQAYRLKLAELNKKRIDAEGLNDWSSARKIEREIYELDQRMRRGHPKK